MEKKYELINQGLAFWRQALKDLLLCCFLVACFAWLPFLSVFVAACLLFSFGPHSYLLIATQNKLFITRSYATFSISNAM